MLNDNIRRIEGNKIKDAGIHAQHGFPIKALAGTGEMAPQELSDNGFINATNRLQESNKRINSKSDAVMENTETNETIEWENRKESAS